MENRLCPDCKKIICSRSIKCASCAQKGRVFSEEHKEKMRFARIGRTLTGEHKMNVSKSLMGRPVSKETREKLRKSNLGKPHGKMNPDIVKKRNETRRKNGWYKDPLDVSIKRSKLMKERLKDKTNHYNYGKNLSKKTIKKIKEARAKQILPVKNTKIETKIQGFLKHLGIDFFTHQYMKEIEHSYQCDIFIPVLNMIIECDGNYWHKYPVGRDIDHIRTKELLEKGFKVLRFWEFEIKEMDLGKFRGTLESA